MRRPVHLLLLLCTAVVSVTCQSTVPFHLLHEDGQCARAGVYFMPTFNLESAQSSFILSVSELIVLLVEPMMRPCFQLMTFAPLHLCTESNPAQAPTGP